MADQSPRKPFPTHFIYPTGKRRNRKMPKYMVSIIDTHKVPSYIWVIMGLLSEQIRELIRNCSTSPFAIARAAGIDSTSISRFMNGGNITVKKLDQLARILGVEIQSSVSLVPRALEKGRPAKKETKVALSKERIELELDAYHLAEDAYANHSSSRRGVWHIEDLDCLFVYNSNAFLQDPKARPRELRRVINRLKAAGVNLLARSSAGSEVADSNERYTVGILLDCSIDRMDEVTSILQEEAWRSRREVGELTRSKKTGNRQD